MGFTEIVLALSGVEAVANMTGIMVPAGGKDRAARTILPVLIEIVILNLILAAADERSLPDALLYVTDASGVVQRTAPTAIRSWPTPATCSR